MLSVSLYYAVLLINNAYFLILLNQKPRTSRNGSRPQPKDQTCKNLKQNNRLISIVQSIVVLNYETDSIESNQFFFILLPKSPPPVNPSLPPKSPISPLRFPLAVWFAPFLLFMLS